MAVTAPVTMAKFKLQEHHEGELRQGDFSSGVSRLSQ